LFFLFVLSFSSLFLFALSLCSFSSLFLFALSLCSFSLSLWDSTDDDEEYDDDGTPLGTPLSRGLQYYDVSVREIKEQMRMDRRAARKIKRKIKLKRKKGKQPTSSERNKLERKIELLKHSIDLSVAMQRAVMEAAHAELSFVRNQNAFYLSRKRLFRAQENSRRIGLHSRKRNQEEQKLRRIARDQRALANEAAGIAEEKVRLKRVVVYMVVCMVVCMVCAWWCAWCVHGVCMVVVELWCIP
jgi:hypothetical protein